MKLKRARNLGPLATEGIWGHSLLSNDESGRKEFTMTCGLLPFLFLITYSFIIIIIKEDNKQKK